MEEKIKIYVRSKNKIYIFFKDEIYFFENQELESVLESFGLMILRILIKQMKILKKNLKKQKIFQKF